MAKIKIPFGGNEYLIEESALDAATAELKQHLSTVMNGSGTTINLDGTSYDIDSTKLSNATNAFVAHLGTIAGSGSEIVVGGVKYNVDSTKLNNAITEMHNVLNNLKTEGDGSGESNSCPVHFGKKYIHHSIESNGTIYIEITFYEDGRADSKILVNGEPLGTGTSVPGYFIYEGNNIIMSKNGELAYIVSDDGNTLVGQADISDGAVFVLEGSEEGGDATSCPIHFGEVYKAYDEGAVKTIVFTENGSFIIRINGEDSSSGDRVLIYEGNTIKIPFGNTIETLGTVSSDGTVVIINGITFTLSDPALNLTSIPEGTYYGNAITNEYYDTMPKTVNEYDFFAYEDYLYVYMSHLNGWVVTLVDEMAIEQSIQMGMNVTIPSDFVLSDRTKTSYSEVLETINGIPVTTMSLTYAYCSNMITAPTIPDTIVYLEGNYEGCTSLMNITYAGTMAQWNNVTKENGWNTGIPATQVVCSDGTVTL